MPERRLFQWFRASAQITTYLGLVMIGVICTLGATGTRYGEALNTSRRSNTSNLG